MQKTCHTRRMPRALYVSAAVFSLVGAVFYTYGDVLQDGAMEPTVANMLVDGLFTWVLGFLALVGLTRVALRARERRGRHEAAHGRRLSAPRLTRRSVLAFAGIMLLCWLPYAIALCPSCFGYDTYGMINQNYPGHVPVAFMPVEDPTHQFTDHHPIFDTLVFGLFARGSDLLTGSCNPGIFLYSVLQMSATALGMVALLGYTERLGVPRGARLAAFAYLCAVPFYPIYALSMLKDPLHFTLIPPYAMLVLETVRTRGELYACERHGRRNLVASVALGVLLSLTKKTGIYLVVLDAVVFAVAYRAHWRALLAPGAAALLTMTVVVPVFVYPALDVAPGGVQESLGPAIAQTARFVTYHGDEVTPEEREAIDAVINYATIPSGYTYKAGNIDRVKYTYRWRTCTRDDIARYLRVWLAMGLREPGTYMAATLDTCTNFFDWNGVISIYPRAYVCPLAANKLHIWEPAALASAREGALELYRGFARTPFLWVLCQMALYVWAVPSLAWCVAEASHSRLRLAFVPLAVEVLMLLLSPAQLTRYALPLIWLAPVLLALTLRNGCESEASSVQAHKLCP